MSSINEVDATYLNKSARRQLTVLFCDLVGSVEISEALDIEEWLEFLRIYQNSCKEIIQRYNGHIAQYLGDGLLVYFGYPVAFENSPHNAATAALEILKSSDNIEARVRAEIEGVGPGIKLQMRMAIHTGPVVIEGVGGQAESDYLALGVVPAVASRLQDKAPPNSVIISEATHAILRSSFECESIGEVSLKGVSGAQKAYLLRSDKGIHTRFEAVCESGLSAFVSRDEELEFLASSWQKAQAGPGVIVMVQGDPGIGKSRLLKEFGDRHVGSDCLRLTFQCSPYHKDSALYPLIVMVQRLLGIGSQDTEEVKLDKIVKHIADYGLSSAEALPILANLLSVSYQARFPSIHASVKRATQQQFQSFYFDWIVLLARGKPIYFLVEDYHWVDPSTEDFLKQITTRVLSTNVLLIVSHRPEAELPWSCKNNVVELTLGPLPRSSVEALIRKLWDGEELPPPLIDQLIKSTDGVPLFIEESIMMVRNQEAEPSSDVDKMVIPATLQDLLLARLDRAGEAKHVAQLAATIGREFEYALLAAISPYEQDTLENLLNQLITAGLLCVVSSSEGSVLFFKHALIRDIAYQSLLVSQTRKIHKALSLALCEHFPDYKLTQPEIIAFHFTKAACYMEAIDYWKQAGRRAIGLHAHLEAATHLREALKLVEKLPEDSTRKNIELELNTLMGGRIIVTEGYGADMVKEYYSRALDLAEELENLPLTQKIMFGLEGFHFIKADFETARQYLDRCLLIADKLGDTSSTLKVHWSFGEVYFHLGDHPRAQAYLENCLKLYSEAESDSRVLQDPGVMSHMYMSWTQWMSGCPDQSLQSAKYGATLANKLNHPLSKAIAYCMYGGLNLFRGEYRAAFEHAETAIAICEDRGFQFWLAYSKAVKGRSLVLLDDCETGIELIREGLRMWEASGTMVTRPYYRSLLAESLDIAGQTEEAHSEIRIGLDVANSTGEGYYLPEVYRILGELTYKLSPQDVKRKKESQQYIEQAIELARKQSAKSFELRAVTSLARIHADADVDHVSRHTLESVYGSFQEGWETSDLILAKSLIKQLH